jgi:hypothetical protein
MPKKAGRRGRRNSGNNNGKPAAANNASPGGTTVAAAEAVRALQKKEKQRRKRELEAAKVDADRGVQAYMENRYTDALVATIRAYAALEEHAPGTPLQYKVAHYVGKVHLALGRLWEATPFLRLAHRAHVVMAVGANGGAAGGGGGGGGAATAAAAGSGMSLDVAMAMTDLAAVRFLEGKWSDSEVFYDEAVRIQRILAPHLAPFQLPGNSQRDVGDALHNVGRLREWKGKPAQALELCVCRLRKPGSLPAPTH